MTRADNRWALYLLPTLFIYFQMVAPLVSLSGITPVINLASFMVIYFAIGLNAVATNRIDIFYPSRPVFWLMIWAVVLMIKNYSQVASITHLSQFIAGYGAIYLAASQLRTLEQARDQIRLLCRLAIADFYVAYALTVVASLAGHPFPGTLPWVASIDHRGSLLGSWTLATIFGDLAVIGAMFLFFEMKGGIRWFLIVTIIIASHVVISSSTRTGYLAVVATPFLFLAYNGKVRAGLLTAGTLSFVVLLALVPLAPSDFFEKMSEPLMALGNTLGIHISNAGLVGADMLLSGRTQLWRGMLEMIRDYPIFGAGKNLPYADYGISLVTLASGEPMQVGESQLMLGANDAGFAIPARYGLPFFLLLASAIFYRPLAGLTDRRVYALSNHLVSTMIVFWLLAGSFQFLYDSETCFVVFAAAVSAFSYFQGAERARCDAGMLGASILRGPA